MDRSLYPKDWEAVSLRIRVDRAMHQCECSGQCGLHLPNPEPRRCNEINKQRAKHFNGRVVLTTAHMCDCYPLCGIDAHLLATCQRCHLRIDMWRHSANRLRTMASPSYKTQRYRRAGKTFHIEDLNTIMRLPAKKRRRTWIHKD